MSVIVTPSEVSSVGGDVFFTEEELSDHVEPVVPIECVHLDPEEPADTMEQVIKDVKEGQRLLKVLRRTFTINDLNEISLKSRLPALMEKLEKLSEETMLKFDELTEDYGFELGQERKTEWVSAMAAFEHDVRTYRSGLEARVAQLQATSQQAGAGGCGGELNRSQDQSSFQEEQLRVLREQLEQSKRETTSKEAILVREALETKTKAVAKIKLKAKSVVEDVRDLSDLINKVEIESWNEQDDWLIIQTRRELKSWEEKLKAITAMHREALELMVENSILDGSVVDLVDASNKVEDLTLDFKNVSDAVIAEDLSRELHTMNTSVTEKVKYPSFGGTDEECYQDFKELLDKAFKHNQVSKSAKVAKLKECLKGNAKTIIPESMKDIDLAYSTLEKAFGDPTKLLKVKISALIKLGYCPKQNGKGGVKAVTDWHLKLETTLQTLRDLGDTTSNEDVKAAVHNIDIIRTVAKLFSPNVGVSIIEVANGSTGQARLDLVIAKITTMRVKAQEWQIVQELAPSIPGAGGDGGQGGAGTVGQGSGKKALLSKAQQVPQPALVFYNPPRNDPSCRVCKHLETKGDTSGIYDNHVSNYPTGCPRYMMMSVEERLNLAKAIKLCLRCHHPSYNWKPSDRQHKCGVVDKKKSSFTCPVDSCRIHLWVCSAHKSQNKAAFEKVKQDNMNRHGLTFAYFVGIPVLQSLTSPPPLTTLQSDDASIEVIEPVDDVTTKEVVAQVSLSTEEALNQLKDKLQARSVKEILRPVEKGSPLFILSYTKGKTRPLLTLWDTGCGSVLFKEGVADKEMGPAVLKTPGPIFVNGVGDTTVRVNNEWMTSIKMVDGTRAVLEGCSMDNITAPLPLTNTLTAEMELKSSHPADNNLQSLKSCPVIGGEVDILMGVMYSAIFPVPVHSLTNGLTIYKLLVSSHDDQFTAAIGGPHVTFNTLAGFAGGFTSLFVNLSEQLKNFQAFGPPKLSCSVMTLKHEKFAMEYMEHDMDDLLDVNLEHVLNCSNAEDISDLPELLEDEDDDFNADLLDMRPVCCNHCGVDLLEIGVNHVLGVKDDDDEAQHLIKMLQKSQEDGLNIEYRCPKCRSCSDCMRSHDTERISIREEAEDQMIRDSITIDRAKKHIICDLPVRGEEREFLSSNRDLASKILQQQCTKYEKDSETRESIVKAIDKLIRNKQMVLWSDLSEEQKAQIEAKEVQHYIVWRVVFKNSLSTPARPVFDGSARTRPRPDGSGGRCLNDLVVKGRINSLNLTKMVLKFIAGCFAVQGDLKQFYASLMLTPKFWNLQRVLIKMGLDPNSPEIEAVIRTLIWGIKCVSGQSEGAMMKLADEIDDESPLLADLLRRSRFVDDLGHSESNEEVLRKLIDDADELFEQVGLACKGWTFSGHSPPEEVGEENGTISIGGLTWWSLIDAKEVPIPKLHFSKKVRGRLSVGTLVYEGSCLEDLDKFVPENLTRKQILSRKASLFDLLGKLTPITAGFSLDLRAAMKATQGWNDAVPLDIRKKWVQNFHKLEQLRGIKFQRAVMPMEALDGRMHMINAGDTAKHHIKVAGVWVRFRLKSGKFSCQHLIGRSMLGDENSTIPKQELESLTMCSNMGLITRQTLDKWVESYITISDSTISLCWVSSTENRQSLFTRNRSVQVRRTTDMDNLFHVITSENPADLGTRPDLVKLEDVGPYSTWEKGMPWMSGDISEAVDAGILTPVKNLRMTRDEEDEYQKGFVFERSPEILTRGHVMASVRSQNIADRIRAAGYILNPAKFSFDKTVRIYSIIMKFVKSFKSMQGKSKPSTNKFSMFPIKESRDISEFFETVEKQVKTEVTASPKPEEDSVALAKSVVDQTKILENIIADSRLSKEAANHEAMKVFDILLNNHNKLRDLVINDEVSEKEQMWNVILTCCSGFNKLIKFRVGCKQKMTYGPKFSTLTASIDKRNLEVVTCNIKEQFNMVEVSECHRVKIKNMQAKDSSTISKSTTEPVLILSRGDKSFSGKYHILVNKRDVSDALEYLYAKASMEVTKFNSSDLVKKIAVNKGGILFSKTRILDGQRVQLAGGLEDSELLSNLKDLNLNFESPVLDRFSPLSYSIATYIHEKLATHRGYETCFRCSLDHVFIIQGMGLFREIGDDCIKCKKLRGKYLEIAMGPLPSESFTIAPVFYICQLDIFGPCHVYVPGHNMLLRNRKMVEAKVYVLVFVCMITKCVNLQVVEQKSADGIIDGVNRLGCEVGMPSYILTDQDSGIMKALEEIDVSLKDVDLCLYKERGIRFRTAPVSGHNYHGLVERKIKSVQECLQRSEVQKMRLHATGYQTLMKLVENDLNNLPFGYSYGRYSENTPMMKLIFPNMLKCGRSNKRSLDGPVKMPSSPGDLMRKIQQGYETFFQLWNTVLIPKMMKQTKWYEDKSPQQLQRDDIVYFKKENNVLSNSWTVGKVVDIEVGKDGKVRECEVEYQNFGEDFKRTTNRASRSLQKLFHIDDQSWCEEMSEVEKIIDDLEADVHPPAVTVKPRLKSNSELGEKLPVWVARNRACKKCCCASHCSIEFHFEVDRKIEVPKSNPLEVFEIFDGSFMTDLEFEEDMSDIPKLRTGLMSLICATNMNLADD